MECGTAPETAADEGRARTETASAAERRRCGPEASATTATPKCRQAAAAKSASAMKGVTSAAEATSTSVRRAAAATSAAMLDLCEQGVIRLLRGGRRTGIDQRYRARRWCQRHHHRGCGGDAERAHDQLPDTRASCEALNICHWKHPPSINVAWNIQDTSMTQRCVGADGASAQCRSM
jgi:hypothetical protein